MVASRAASSAVPGFGMISPATKLARTPIKIPRKSQMAMAASAAVTVFWSSMESSIARASQKPV